MCFCLEDISCIPAVFTDVLSFNAQPNSLFQTPTFFFCKSLYILDLEHGVVTMSSRIAEHLHQLFVSCIYTTVCCSSVCCQRYLQLRVSSASEYVNKNEIYFSNDRNLEYHGSLQYFAIVCICITRSRHEECWHNTQYHYRFPGSLGQILQVS